MWVLTSHYRTPLTYTQEALGAAKRGAERLRVAAHTPDDSSAREPAPDPEPYRQRFREAMDEDLNTSKALATLFDLAHEINRCRSEERDVSEAQNALLELADVLGLTLSEREESVAAAPFIELLIELRNELRKAKQFELADSVRARLAEHGIALEDTAQGTIWRRRG
jgi:cysteinyl-tRNA synthetase